MAACHGGIIEQSLVLGFGMPPRTAPGSLLVTPPNTSVTEWAVTTREGGELHWRLTRFADSAHLDGEGRPRWPA